MIDTMRQYTNYRPSGKDWLGKVPGHWRSTSLGAISTRKSTRNRPDLPLLSVLREKGVVLRSSLSQDENHNFIPNDLSNYQVANEGDLVVNKMKAWQGSVGIAPQDGIVSPAYYVFELADIKKKYAHRLLRSRLYADFFGRASDGVRIGQWDLRIPAMKRIPVLIPPPDEQDSIARYLDEMDRRIARFIRNRRRLIEVLNEQKQAIINRAVTRGLDPNAPLKPSGIDWLGNIPGHWKVVPFMRLFAEVYRYPTYYNIQYVKSGVPEVRGEALVHGNIAILPDQRYIAQETNSRFSRTILKKGDLVMSVRGTMGKIGVVGESHVGANITANLLRLSPRQEVARSHYLSWLMRSPGFLSELDRVSPQTTIKTVTMPHLAGLRLCVPPLPEQNAIVDDVEKSTESVNTAISRAQREIDLVREYRTRLISDVVTGKVDVRHLAPPPGGEDLEEMVEALEPLDDEPGELDEEFMNGEISHADD